MSFNLEAGSFHLAGVVFFGEAVTTVSFTAPKFADKKQHLNLQTKDVALGALAILGALLLCSGVVKLALLGFGAYTIYNGSKRTESLVSALWSHGKENFCHDPKGFLKDAWKNLAR